MTDSALEAVQTLMCCACNNPDHHDAAAVLAAASGPWAEHGDDAGTEPPLARGRMTDLPDAVVEAAAEAIYNHQRNDLHNDPEWADVEERFKEMYREEASIALSAASVRNSELEADLLDMTKTASEYNDLAHSANADWSKELERATALQAELDNLRASLTKRTHDWLAHCKRLDAEREAITDDLAKAWKELGEIESGASEDE